MQVPASSTAVVTLKVTLPDMSKFDEVFVNGMFVEGYVFMYDTTRRAVTTDLSLPFIGFRGDWSAAPIFDMATAYEDVSDKSVSDLDYPVYHIDNLHTKNTVGDVTTDAVLGANQFTGAAVPQFNSSRTVVSSMRSYLDTLRKNGNLNGDWSAISPNGDGLADDVYAQFGLLRNAKMLGVQIVDAEGNVVKDLGYEFEYFKLLATDGNLSHIVNTTAYDKYRHALNWDGTDADGKVVADGQYYYKMTALVEADYLDLVNEDSVRAQLNEFIKSLDRTGSLVNGGELQSIKDKLNELVGAKAKALLDASEHTITMPVKVDTEAPVITTEPVTATEWAVKVSDTGSGVQAVVLYYNGEKVADPVLINAKEGSASFDLSGLGEIDKSKLDIQAVDYAMNVATLNAKDAKVVVTVNLTGDEKINAADESLKYTVSMENAVNVATTTVKVTLDGVYAGEPVVVEGVNGFQILSAKFENVDGKLVGTIVAFKLDALTAKEDTAMFTITAANKGVVGTAKATLDDAVVSSYAGQGETYVDVILGKTEATTEVDYLLYDVNHDGVVNQLDLTRAQRYYGTDNAICDVNKDGTVDINDIILILNNYTK